MTGVGAVVVTIAWTAAIAGIRINLTGSIPRGLYRQHVLMSPLKRGALVLACLPRAVAEFARARGYLPRGKCPGGTMPVGKVVVALAGDSVDVRDTGLLVNGVPLALSRPLAIDSRRHSLPMLPRRRYIVAAGEVWLGSRSSTGFDSRYFGAIPEASVQAVIAPLMP